MDTASRSKGLAGPAAASAMYNLANVGLLQPGAQDNFVLSLRATADSALAAIDSDRNLSFVDPSRFGGVAGARLPASVVTVRCPTQLPVSHLEGLGDLMCTAGQDGVVALWDRREPPASAQVVAFQANGCAVESLACCAASHAVAVGTEISGQAQRPYICLWDFRRPGQQVACLDEAHGDDITALTWDPLSPNILLSGSLDGTINLYDLTIPEHDDMTTLTVNNNVSVKKLGYLDRGLIYALSHDEHCAIYDVELAGDRERSVLVQQLGDLRQPLSCHYVADLMPKDHLQGIVIGAGTAAQGRFEFATLAKDPACQGRQGSWLVDMEERVSLPGAHGNELVRSFCFFDEHRLLFTAGEDGLIKAWAPPC